MVKRMLGGQTNGNWKIKQMDLLDITKNKCKIFEEILQGVTKQSIQVNGINFIGCVFHGFSLAPRVI